MSDLVTIATQISTPIKVGWLLWLIWVVVQAATYRWSRGAVPPAPAPVHVAPRPRPAARRRRRRPARQEGAVENLMQV